MEKIFQYIFFIVLFFTCYITVYALEITVNSDQNVNEWYNQDIEGIFELNDFTQFNWHTAWNWCNGCGPRTEYATVSCRWISNNVIYNESACTENKPQDSRSCNGGPCPTNIALGTYNHTKFYNYPVRNDGYTLSWQPWDWLTDGSTNSNEWVWAWGLMGSSTSTSYVSIDLGWIKTVSKIVVKNPRGKPYNNTWNFSKDIYIQTKSSGSCKAWPSGWINRTSRVNVPNKKSYTKDFTTPIQAKCVQIYHANAWDIWGWRDHYTFIAELEVWWY